MKIYNSLSREEEEFQPLSDKKVGIYTCGPTVYDYVTIGNWRTYTFGDLVVRALKFLGYDTDYIMNITDVGHLTGDNLGDADTGEDRLEKAARREQKTAWDVALFYTDDFLAGYKTLNLTEPRIFSVATKHIAEQIAMVRKIEEKGFAYKITDGVYFDTKAYEKAGNKYGELSNIDQVKEGARVEPNPEKKDPRDFALWKFSPQDEKRQMEWDSPWGMGFPGWHIECSAMSTKYLGEQFDIHIGGEDLKSTHHPNEIAQAEAATGKKPFVKYWLHGAFLQVDGGRMGKSLGNAYNLHDIEEKGYDPLTLRYFYLTAHYRDKLNFTWEALGSAQTALNNLREIVAGLRAMGDTRNRLSEEKLADINEFTESFRNALENDLNMPQALAVLWKAVKSNIPSTDKLDLVLTFDQVFGLKLNEVEALQIESFELPLSKGAVDPTSPRLRGASAPADTPDEIISMLSKREEARAKGDYQKSDEIRHEIEGKGYEILDTKERVLIKKK